MLATISLLHSEQTPPKTRLKARIRPDPLQISIFIDFWSIFGQFFIDCSSIFHRFFSAFLQDFLLILAAWSNDHYCTTSTCNARRKPVHFHPNVKIGERSPFFPKGPFAFPLKQQRTTQASTFRPHCKNWRAFPLLS